MLVDDDSFVSPPRLAKELGRFDERMPLQLGEFYGSEAFDFPKASARGIFVSNEGGLSSTNVHSKVGRLDLHGKYNTNFVRISGHAVAGAVNITLASAVTWQPGEELVIMNPTEEMVLEAVHNGGTMIELREPLKFSHHGEFWCHKDDLQDQGCTDIRSVIMTKYRNLKLQGDEWSEVQMFGCRTGMFLKEFVRPGGRGG